MLRKKKCATRSQEKYRRQTTTLGINNDKAKQSILICPPPAPALGRFSYYLSLNLPFFFAVMSTRPSSLRRALLGFASCSPFASANGRCWTETGRREEDSLLALCLLLSDHPRQASSFYRHISCL